MRLIDKEKLMEILCQHCDSHIEMCEECPMKELIESVPEAKGEKDGVHETD